MRKETGASGSLLRPSSSTPVVCGGTSEGGGEAADVCSGDGVRGWHVPMGGNGGMEEESVGWESWDEQEALMALCTEKYALMASYMRLLSYVEALLVEVRVTAVPLFLRMCA